MYNLLEVVKNTGNLLGSKIRVDMLPAGNK
jgi:hypothetical protein